MTKVGGGFRDKKSSNHSRWDNEGKKNTEAHSSRRRSSFFFCLFPDKYGAKEMYKEFQDFVHAGEVVIPSKRDKRGMHYDFDRFFDIRDEYFLATKLDNIFLEGRKLYANVHRF